MTPRLRTLALLATLPAIAACGRELPTQTETVQLRLVSGAEHGGAPLSVPMTQEVTSANTGDPDGTGLALITINIGQREVCWELTVADITLPATASHIHRAPPGVAGPAVVWLSPPDLSGTAVGCRSEVDRALLQEILQNPGAFYVNVHNGDHPPGAIRGQLDR